jgi:hypothetical protein
LGSIATTQTSPKARQPGQVPTRLARHDARRPFERSARFASGEEERVRGNERHVESYRRSSSSGRSTPKSSTARPSLHPTHATRKHSKRAQEPQAAANGLLQRISAQPTEPAESAETHELKATMCASLVLIYQRFFSPFFFVALSSDLLFHCVAQHTQLGSLGIFSHFA